MNDTARSSKLARLARVLARNVVQVVAVVAIAVAFLLGYQLGQPDAHDHAAEPGTPAAASASATMYTCSMHPQVRLPDPDAKCPICFMDLIPVGEGDDAGGDGRPTLTMTEEAAYLAEIETAPAVRRYPEGEIRLVGRIEIDETRVRTIAAHFPGRLERLYVDYTGIRVAAGDHVADIYSPDLIAAQEELRAAREALERDSDRGATIQALTEATYQAARDKLRLWGLGEAQIDELETEPALRERVTVHAPIGGIVVDKMATEGAYVETGTELFRVADLDRLWVLLEAYESQLPWLRFGQDVTFTTEAYPGEEFHGTISFIDPIVSPDTRTVSVRVNVDDAGGRLKPGMFVRTRVRARVAADGRIVNPELRGKWISPMHPEIVKDEPGTCDVCGMPLVPVEELGYDTGPRDAPPPVVIPASAPLLTGERAVVYVRLPDADEPVFEGRNVVLGPRVGDVYVVREGIEEGEQVVVHGAFKIDAAMQIAARPSMMSPPEDERPSAPSRPEVPAEVLASLTGLYETYLVAQTALADDELPGFLEAARIFDERLETVPDELLRGEDRGRFARARRALDVEPASLGEVDSLAAAREIFDRWSPAIIALAKRFGHAGDEALVVAHCPMAFNNRGADWLQRGETIDNPYFGASMLRCGTVEERIPPVAEARR